MSPSSRGSPGVTAIIAAHDESANIEACIASVEWAGEVIVVEKRGVAVAELVPLRTLTTAEVFRERERSGYFKKLRKTNSNIDRYISEGR